MRTIIFSCGLLLGQSLASVAALAATPQALVSAQADTLDDRQLLQVLVVALQRDIDTAREAIQTSHHIRVKSMADDLWRDSTELLTELHQLVGKTGLEALPSAQSEALHQRSVDALNELRQVYGHAFDHAFLKAEIEAEYTLIGLLDQGSGATVLDQLRSKARVAAVRHLLFAQQLRGDLKWTGADAPG